MDIEAQCIAAWHEWMDGHADEARRIGFDFLEVRDTSLTFKAAGNLVQLILPSQLFSRGSSCEEIFLAMILDGEKAHDRLMLRLNEKLERIEVGPGALSRVLDAFVAVLSSMGGKAGMSLGWLKEGSEEGWKGEGGRLEMAEEDSGSEDGTREKGERMGEGEGDIEHHMQGGEEGVFCQYERGSSRKRPAGSALHGIFREASEAGEMCEAVLRECYSSLLSLNARRAGLMDALGSMDVLMFCEVSYDPRHSSVRLLMELPGLINDIKVANALRLSFDHTLELELKFEEDLPSIRYMEPERVLARQRRASNGLSQGAGVETTDATEEEFNQVYNRCCGWMEKSEGYGLSVLLPELVRVFFAYRAMKWPPALRQIQWNNLPLDGVLKRCADVENPFIGLLSFIGTQMRALPSWCVVCWSLLPSSVWRLRTCHNELCLYKFEELGIGSDILHEIRESPLVVELELSLACAAATRKRDVFEPFPGFLLETGEKRGRCGWFSTQNVGTSAASVGSSLPNVAITSRKKATEADHFDKTKNKNIERLKSALRSIPRLQELKECADEYALRRRLARSGYTGPTSTSQQMSLSYDLARFIMSTNRLSLRALDPSEQLHPFGTLHQFVVLHDSPEREAHFETQRERKGSFFAFHGSSLANWYSILRNGLRSMSSTHMMSSGAAHGPGIYLAANLMLSFTYASNSKLSDTWLRGTWEEGFVVVAICEVVNGITMRHNSENVYVVPPDKQDDVLVRYLLLCARDNPSGGRIEGTILADSKNDTRTDLLRHYQDIKAADRVKHEVQLLDQRIRALKKMAEMGADLTFTRGKSHEIPPSSPNIRNPAATGASSASDRVDNAAGATATATQAIAKEYKNIFSGIREAITRKTASAGTFLNHITIELPDDSTLYKWHVRLDEYLFQCSPLHKELIEWAKLRKETQPHILLEVTFSGKYPFQPPFIRVVYPRFLLHTGHVTVGGSICMEVLTDSGWTPALSLENVLVQIVNGIVEGGGRIDTARWYGNYTAKEAQEAFDRVAKFHGWSVSKS